MPSPILTSQPSNYLAIQQAIASIAQTGQSTIQFSSGSIKIGEVPAPNDLEAQDALGNFVAGYPFFAVRQGKVAGFATGLAINGAGDAGERGIEIIEPVWDFDCYVFYKYDVKVPNYDLAATALVTMTKLFIENYTLNGTCPLSNPHSWALPYAQIGNQELVAAKWTLRVYEVLSTSYL